MRQKILKTLKRNFSESWTRLHIQSTTLKLTCNIQVAHTVRNVKSKYSIQVSSGKAPILNLGITHEHYLKVPCANQLRNRGHTQKALINIFFIIKIICLFLFFFSVCG